AELLLNGRGTALLLYTGTRSGAAPHSATVRLSEARSAGGIFKAKRYTALSPAGGGQFLPAVPAGASEKGYVESLPGHVVPPGRCRKDVARARWPNERK